MWLGSQMGGGHAETDDGRMRLALGQRWRCESVGHRHANQQPERLRSNGSFHAHGYGPPPASGVQCQARSRHRQTAARLLDWNLPFDASGKLLEVDPDGATTVMDTGFENCGLLFFGKDGSLYVTDPPNSRILRVKPQVAALTIQMSAVELSWPTRADKSYQVQCRSSLTTNQWSDLGAPIAGNSGIRCLNDSSRGFSQRFYRVIELP